MCIRTNVFSWHPDSYPHMRFQNKILESTISRQSYSNNIYVVRIGSFTKLIALRKFDLILNAYTNPKSNSEFLSFSKKNKFPCLNFDLIVQTSFAVSEP